MLRKFVFVISMLVFVLISYFIVLIFDNGYIKCEIFYPSNDCSGLYSQTKMIKNNKNKRKFVENIVEETLLGAINHVKRTNKTQVYTNSFPKESKLLSLFVNNEKVYLNFNKELLLNVQNDNFTEILKANENLKKQKKCKFSLNYLILYSIIDSVNFNCPDLIDYQISFEGVSYKYIDNFGPMDCWLQSNFDILVK